MPSRILKMKVAGRFIDLLGHQMYGGLVPSVSEFIANAWDADAPKVELTIPDDPKVDNAEIVIKDFGEGMTFEEINDFYLNIGYERRKTKGEITNSGRLVMGRKGIGKLAGFGIAEEIVIRSVKHGQLIQFRLNYNDLKSRQELQGYEFAPELDEVTSESSGVTVTLKKLKIERRIDINSFRKSCARRFAVNTDLMEIIINGEKISKEDLDFEYRLPENNNDWIEEEIDGFGVIKYWFGFLKETIKDSELRGVSVFARDRVAQFTPFFFNLSGGINGQVGLEYLTGQVKANELDSEIDYIATPRQTVNWKIGKATILEAWGQGKIKELCRDWKKRKDDKNLEKFKHDYSEYFPRINALPDQEKKDLMAALERIASLDRIQTEEFTVIANSMINGIERESVRKVINRINTVSEDALPELWEAIRDWDIISAVAMSEVISGRIEIISQFEKHIEARLPEKAKAGKLDMQTFIKEHPWLLGQKYEDLVPADVHHEKGVDKWISEVLNGVNTKEYKNKDEKEGIRFDLLCIKNEYQILIIELMRPGIPADYDHISRLYRYCTKVQTAIDQMDTESAYAKKSVVGLLICDKWADDPTLSKTIQEWRHILDATTWKGLFTKVQAGYRQYLEIQKCKAPEDPRIKGLIIR